MNVDFIAGINNLGEKFIRANRSKHPFKILSLWP